MESRGTMLKVLVLALTGVIFMSQCLLLNCETLNFNIVFNLTPSNDYKSSFSLESCSHTVVISSLEFSPCLDHGHTIISDTENNSNCKWFKKLCPMLGFKAICVDASMQKHSVDVLCQQRPVFNQHGLSWL